MSGISGTFGDLSSSITTATDVASTALSMMGMILLIYGLFAIFRAVSNNEPIPFSFMFFGLFFLSKYQVLNRRNNCFYKL